MVKEIPLTNSNLVALVDDEDYERVMQYKWCVDRGRKTFYAKAWVKGKVTRMHRFILNAKPKEEVDHIDHYGLNNLRNNIRITTHSQNMMNGRKREGTSSKYKGVFWCNTHKRWVSSIRINGVLHTFSYLSNEEDAAHAYDKKAKELFGEFACLNFPIPDQ
jgi:hypothetical protein